MFSAYILALPLTASAHKIILTNDDGWAVANIRAQYQQLNAAYHDVRAVSRPTPMTFL